MALNIVKRDIWKDITVFWKRESNFCNIMYYHERSFPSVPNFGKYPTFRGICPGALQGLTKGFIFAPHFFQMRTARMQRTLYECTNPKQTK